MKEAAQEDRIVIEKVSPCIDCGAFPIKRAVGEEVTVTADVYTDGHDKALAYLLYKENGEAEWHEAPMKDLGNDAWSGSFAVENEKDYFYSVRGYMADLSSKRRDPKRSFTYKPGLRVSVERRKALFSSWYELFPRSWSAKPGKHGTLKDCERILPEIARMGFDVVYLPPIHPIGKSYRKGKNNSVKCSSDDPGSPWAVGSAEGGHKAIHPQLGTFKDLRSFVERAKECDLEAALDIAFQCSPDHPYVKSHPEWFKWRPDGKIQYAENPPKKYEDIVPFNFDTTDRMGLWEELKSVILFWAGYGIRIFRVDNPHTKPFVFWDWLIGEVKKEFSDAIFLSEAFTRPKVMYRLAKSGFSQSYTYFTWRNTKQEFRDYLTELTRTEIAEVFRPNFWPNTPDILAGHLQGAGAAAFAMRLVMAATLSSNYGIYGPAFELCVNTPLPGKEEYLDSEKYEIKRWNWDQHGNIKDLIARVNKIRRDNPALQATRNIRFCDIDNDRLLAYCKMTSDHSNVIIVVVNLDPGVTQSGWLQLPLDEFGIDKEASYTAHDLLSDQKYSWRGARSYIELDPVVRVAHIIRISKG
ncbi:MAG: maltotransferase domain-containing protein [Candidatus Omnitrophota bacterium]